MVLREILAKFGIQFDNKALIAGDSSIAGVIGRLGVLGKTLAGGLAVFGLTRMVDHMAEWGDELGDTSTKLGITANDLLQWRHAAGLSGVSAESLSTALGILQKNAFEASTGSKSMAKDFARLGVQLKKPNGQLKDGSELLQEVGAALGGLESDSERVALAMNLLGRSGKEMLPLFKEGAEGMEAMRQEVRDLFGDLSEFVSDSDKAKDAQGRFNMAVIAMKVIVVRDIVPVMMRFYNALTSVTKGLSVARRDTRIFEAALVTLGGVITALTYRKLPALAKAFWVTFSKPMALFLIAAIAIAFIVLVVEDLISLFSGGRSVIGEFIDSLFGMGAAANFVNGTKDAFAGLLATIRDAWKLTTGLWDALAGMVKLGFGVFPLLIEHISASIAAKILGIVAKLKRGMASAIAFASKAGSVFGLDLTKDAAAASANASLAEGAAATQAASARATGAAIQNKLSEYKITVNGVGDPEEVKRRLMQAIREKEEEDRRTTLAALTQNVG